MGDLSDHELKPVILVKGARALITPPFKSRCYFEQKEPAPDEVCIPRPVCALHTGLHSPESLPPPLGDH